MNDLSPFPMAEDDPTAAQSSQRAAGAFLSFLRFRKKEVWCCFFNTSKIPQFEGY
jgi:hypothetical protein